MTTTPIPTITQDELADRLTDDPDLQLINVLEPQYDELGLISGSTRIPLSQLDDRLDELDKSAQVVTYCASAECPASRKAAEKLAGHGFNVRAYEGGLKEWKSAGRPMETD